MLPSGQAHTCNVDGGGGTSGSSVVTGAASTPESGQSSPPNGHTASRSSSGSTPIHEEGRGSPYGRASGAQGSCSDLTLHQSPSLPNISLGRPAHSTQPVSTFYRGSFNPYSRVLNTISNLVGQNIPHLYYFILLLFFI